MLEAYEKQIQSLHEEVAELGRIRRALLAHLGESLLQEVHGNPELRRGREQILAGIDRAERKSARLEDRLAELDARLFAARQEQQVRDEQATGVAASVTAPVQEQVADEAPVAAADDEAQGVPPEEAPAPEEELPSAEEAVSSGVRDEVVTLQVSAQEEAVGSQEGAQDEDANACVCPSCGAPVGAAHKFCMTCGRRLR